MKLSKKIKLALATTLMTVSLVGGAAVAANADTAYPSEGGVWDYGVDYWNMHVYSNYYHDYRTHGSTACDAMTNCTWSGWTSPGVRSYATYAYASFGGNQAYYSIW